MSDGSSGSTWFSKWGLIHQKRSDIEIRMQNKRKKRNHLMQVRYVPQFWEFAWTTSTKWLSSPFFCSTSSCTVMFPWSASVGKTLRMMTRRPMRQKMRGVFKNRNSPFILVAHVSWLWAISHSLQTGNTARTLWNLFWSWLDQSNIPKFWRGR